MTTTTDRIEVGDEVQVAFNNANKILCHRATVQAIPSQPGDSWIFQELLMDRRLGRWVQGALYYVSEGCTITKLKPLPPGPTWTYQE